MITNISTVLEAAQIRVDQWQAIADGQSPHDVVDELYETDADEARSIAEEQSAAIEAVRSSLPAKSYVSPIDCLASTAMCIWEHVLDTQRRFKAHSITDEPLQRWMADGEGAFAARDGCWALAGWTDWAWSWCESNGIDHNWHAFDWEFVPEFIDALYHVCSDRQIAPDAVDEDYVLMAIQAIIKS
jgi:hypothetical protein